MRKAHGLPISVFQPGIPRRDKPMMIYFAQSELTHLIKIGITGNLKQRMYQLKGKIGCAVMVLGIIRNCKPYDEYNMHAKFRESRDRCEWFYPDKQLMEFVADLEKPLAHELPGGKKGRPCSYGNTDGRNRLWTRGKKNAQ